MENISFIKKVSLGLKERIKLFFHNPYGDANLNWLRIKYLKHISNDKIHSHLLLNRKTFFYDGPGYLHGIKEIFIEKIYAQLLPENAYILDCGAHIGLSVIYLKSICPSANIVCFEPDSKNFQLLQKNMSSHQLKNIDARQEAVWFDDTYLDFIQEGSMASKITSNDTGGNSKVKAIRLKNYINKQVDFLKLDIEGAEYLVLKDIAENLGNVINMFVEYHGSFSQNQELLEIFQIIVESGFQFYIKEAAENYLQPFLPTQKKLDYDVQLNIFCFRLGINRH